jgi:hypothetical protein
VPPIARTAHALARPIPVQNDGARDRQICIDRRASLPRPAPTLGALRPHKNRTFGAVDNVELGPEAPFCVLHGAIRPSFLSPRSVRPAAWSMAA